MSSDAAVEAARNKTASECLANRIMALRDTRCEAHSHYLCDACAGRWIAAHTEGAVKELNAQWGIVMESSNAGHAAMMEDLTARLASSEQEYEKILTAIEETLNNIVCLDALTDAQLAAKATAVLIHQWRRQRLTAAAGGNNA